ncbi:hypothetical protein AMJ80_07075 [bacterium SM23_31]|nr:MAG: hypothetical protein AMJ80_07075 [bacterium SM23_31]
MLLIVGCGTQQIDENGIRNAVTGVLTAQQKAWNEGNVEEFMAGYRRSEDLTFASEDTVSRGWEAVLKRYKTKYTPETMGQLNFSDLKITPLSPDAAYVIGTWALKREPDNPGGKFTLIFRKFEEGWKIVHDHTSSRVK